MTDLSKSIEPKSDQMNADDLIAGPVDITITDVRGGNEIQPINVHYQGDNGKPFKPCKSMRRVMVAAWGVQGKEYAGKSMRLFCDPKVKFGGIEVGGIRISHMTGIAEDMTIALTVSKANRKPFTVKVMEPSADQVDNATAKAAAIAQAKSAASCGTTAFMSWFNSDDGKAVRGLFKEDAEVMADLKTACSTANAQLSSDMVDEEFGEQ